MTPSASLRSAAPPEGEPHFASPSGGGGAKRRKGYACPLDAWLADECGARSPEELPARLEQAQLAALIRAVRHARRSSFYAARLPGFTPQSLADLSRLPFTRPEDLDQYEKFLCVSLGEVERLVTLHTSGTTGPPKRLAFTAGDLARTRDFFAVGMSMLVTAGQTLAVLLPGAERPDGVADLLRHALEPRGVTVIFPPPALLRETETPNLTRWLEQTRPHCLVAAPQPLARLLEAAPDGPPGLSSILASADALDAALRRALAQSWNCLVLDHYGLTETGYGCAVECPAADIRRTDGGSSGYHIRTLDALVEIVDPDGDAVLPPGNVGEVVITTLNREAMPLVRYRTGDAASLLPGPCACGSPLPRLGPILGRIGRDEDGRTRIVRTGKGGARP